MDFNSLEYLAETLCKVRFDCSKGKPFSTTLGQRLGSVGEPVPHSDSKMTLFHGISLRNYTCPFIYPELEFAFLRNGALIYHAMFQASHIQALIVHKLTGSPLSLVVSLPEDG